MIDIATTTPKNSESYGMLAVPLDWVLLEDKGIAQPWHDASNLCRGSVDYVQEFTGSYAFALESGLHTSVCLSLYTDARAGNDDRLPFGTTDRRGWVGDAFTPNLDKRIGGMGSRLWLNYYNISTPEVIEAQRFAAYESLLWLVTTGVIDTIDVQANVVNHDATDLLALHIIMSRDNQNEPIYDAVWGAALNHPEGHYAS